MSRKSRRGAFFLAGALTLALGAGAVMFTNRGSTSAASTGTRATAPTSANATDRHRVWINEPDGPPLLPTGKFDRRGEPIVANCTTCHVKREPNSKTRNGNELKDFHTGLITNHGNLTCLSCHNPDDYSALRLASGEALPYTDVIQLCAQCHGPQYRDYQHGSHGGMTGYWDLTRGGRRRNNCLDCHDAHAPQYPRVRPVLPPNDRFLREKPAHSEEGTHG